jgi:mannitol/fructose-specific phosphotransferase system IIA component (Ntr-type)
MKLATLLQPRLVYADLAASSPKEALRILVNRLVSAGAVEAGEDTLRVLSEREKLMPTGIGNGVAVPEGLTPEVESTVVALARCAKGIPFGAADGTPAHLVVLVLGPPELATEHRDVLEAIAEVAKEPGLLESVLAAPGAPQLLEAVRAADAAAGNARPD